MAYSTVPTLTTGDSWTAAQHNTYVRDNFVVTAPATFTKKGDFLVATAAGVGYDLQSYLTDDGWILQADSALDTNMDWNGDVISANISKTSQSIPASTLTAITALTDVNVDYYPITFHPGATDAFLTIPTGLGGIYLCGCSGYYDSAGADAKLMTIQLIGADASIIQSSLSQNGKATSLAIVYLANLAAGAHISMSAQQYAAGAVVLNSPTVWVLKVR